MAEPFLSEIRIMSFNFAPQGWAMCNGQLLPINQNQALFSLLGTTYGGDGRQTFALPDLRTRIPIHQGGGHTLGERAGEVAHTLMISEMATHNHQVIAINDVPAAGNPGHTPDSTKLLSKAKANVSGTLNDVSLYSSGAIASPLNSGTINPTGGSQPHQNQQPYLALNFCIALIGIFPSQT
jgi:microcystin-dependent protein